MFLPTFEVPTRAIYVHWDVLPQPPDVRLSTAARVAVGRGELNGEANLVFGQIWSLIQSSLTELDYVPGGKLTYARHLVDKWVSFSSPLKWNATGPDYI